MPAEKMDDSEPAHSTDLAQAPASEPVDDGSPLVEVDVVHEVDQWRDHGVDRSLVARAVEAAIAAAGPAGDDPCEITVLLTSDAQIRELNGKWRGQERPTNVLSFPLAADGTPPGGLLLLGYATRIAYELGLVPAIRAHDEDRIILRAHDCAPTRRSDQRDRGQDRRPEGESAVNPHGFLLFEISTGRHLATTVMHNPSRVGTGWAWPVSRSAGGGAFRFQFRGHTHASLGQPALQP